MHKVKRDLAQAIGTMCNAVISSAGAAETAAGAAETAAAAAEPAPAPEAKYTRNDKCYGVDTYDTEAAAAPAPAPAPASTTDNAPAAAGTADAWGTGVCLTCLGVLQGEFGALCEEVAKDVGESGFEVLRAGDLKLCFAVPAAVLVREKSACLSALYLCEEP